MTKSVTRTRGLAAEELEPLLVHPRGDRHDRVERRRDLRRDPDALEVIEVEPGRECQLGVLIGQQSTPANSISRSESLSRPPLSARSFRCQYRQGADGSDRQGLAGDERHLER